MEGKAGESPRQAKGKAPHRGRPQLPENRCFQDSIVAPSTGFYDRLVESTGYFRGTGFCFPDIPKRFHVPGSVTQTAKKAEFLFLFTSWDTNEWQDTQGRGKTSASAEDRTQGSLEEDCFGCWVMSVHELRLPFPCMCLPDVERLLESS